MPERDFKGIWIPAHVWLDDRLNALEKVILAEINSLDGEKGCWASNDYISEFCQCSASKVSKAISKLVELGYIRVESFNGRCRVLRSSLAKNARQTSKKCQADEQILPVNNIKNKIDNKINDIEKRKRFIPPTVSDVSNYCKERGSSIDPEQFVDFYEAKGWRVGNQPMKDWKAAVRTWEKREEKQNGSKPKKRRKFETVLIDGQYVDVEVDNE